MHAGGRKTSPATGFASNPSSRLWLTSPQYNTLINGASSLRGTTINIPTGLMVQQGLCRNVPYPTREMILELRRACNDLSEMCHGNAAKGIAGWKNCWDEVEPTLRTE